MLLLSSTSLFPWPVQSCSRGGSGCGDKTRPNPLPYAVNHGSSSRKVLGVEQRHKVPPRHQLGAALGSVQAMSEMSKVDSLLGLLFSSPSNEASVVMSSAISACLHCCRQPSEKSGSCVSSMAMYTNVHLLLLCAVGDLVFGVEVYHGLTEHCRTRFAQGWKVSLFLHGASWRFYMLHP